MAYQDNARDAGDYNVDDYGQGPEEVTATPISTLTNITAAVISLALIAGVAVWGYKLMVRDVSGIPIVRAVEGDMRVRPEEPGGQLAEHQGLAVNEIAARGKAAGPVDQVRLAPPAMALASEDQPVAPQPDAAPTVDTSVYSESDDETPVVTEAAAEDLRENLRQGEIDQVVAALMAEIEPAAASAIPSQADDGAAVTPQPAAVRADETLNAQPAVLVNEARVSLISAPGIKKSVRPKIRPQDGLARVRAAAYSEPETTPEIDASDIPSGTRLAQLGAYESPEVARLEWTRIEERFDEVLRGKSRVVQEVQSGGRTFYRLRAMGFVDLSDARRFCSALTAEGVECIPVQVR